MKRLFYFLFTIILFGNLYSQTYKVNLYFDYYNQGKIRNSSSNSRLIITFYFTDGSSQIVHHSGSLAGRSSFSYAERQTHTFNKKLSYYHLSAFMNRRNGRYDTNYNSIKNIPICGSVNDYHTDGFRYNTRIIINVEPVVGIENKSLDENIGYNDVFSIGADQNSVGFDSESYNWLYSYDLINWQNMPIQTQGLSEFSIIPNEFLDETETGNKIFFKNNSCDNFDSNRVELTLLKSAPKITNHTIENPSCLGVENGSVTLALDRPLDEGIEELLDFSLMNKNKIVGTNPDTGRSIFETVKNYQLEYNQTSVQFKNLPKGNYRIDLVGSMENPNDPNDTIATYTSGVQHSLDFIIENPIPISLTTAKIKEVSCHGGMDGGIKINATGEMGRSFEYLLYTDNSDLATWQAFSNPNSGEEIISTLPEGDYKIMVRDSKGCVASQLVDITNSLGEPDQAVGDVIINNIPITQPAAPLEAVFSASKQPTSFGFSDGELEVTLTGGTPNYTFALKNSVGQAQAYNITDNQGAEGTAILFTGLASDSYNLEVTDANYSAATQKDNCQISGQTYFLAQPQPLEVKLSIEKVLSCHKDNEYGDETDLSPFDGQRDESQDAKILAEVTGGVPLDVLTNQGKPYFYTWKKQNLDGSWTDLSNQKDSIAINLSAGNYALNVEDKNGVVLGTYTNNMLVAEQDSTLVVNSPAPLVMNITKTNPVCISSSSGNISSVVSGGVVPYNYQWSNGDTSPNLEDLIGGNYFVQVRDAMGCQVKGSVELENPENIVINTLSLQNPSCFGSTNGYISAEATGGSGSFDFEWQDNDTSGAKTNLGAGNYTLTVTDSEGCQASKTWELTQPEALIIDLGPDRKLCKNQSLNFDAAFSNYTDPLSNYQWSGPNGFSANESSIDIQGGQGGTYNVTGTDSRGCMASDQVIVINSDAEVDAEFLVTSQAFVGEEIVLVETSLPRPDNIEWIVPDGVEVLKDEDGYLHVVINEVGNHTFGLKTYVDGCYEYFYKNVQIETQTLPTEPEKNEPFVKDFTISPNPNDGTFFLNVEFIEPSTAHFRLVSIEGNYLIKDHVLSGKDKYAEEFKIVATTGVYVAILETKKGVHVKKVIIL